MISKTDYQHLSSIFNGPEGRYNYFPRITGWSGDLTSGQWFSNLEKHQEKNIDLYIHIPFCERFCHFCGCNIKVAAKSDIIESYIQKVHEEWASYTRFGFRISNLYLGGGTPNSLTPSQLTKLLSPFHGTFDIHTEYDPRHLSFDFLSILKERGLRTISMGIQDFDEIVLATIGRKTDFQVVEENLRFIKDLDLDKVNIDLIYALPKQGESSLKLLDNFLQKDLVTGISLYPFAEVPWFKDFYPSWQKERISLEQKSSLHYDFLETMTSNGFSPISFGHFAKKQDGTQYERTIMGFNQNCESIVIALGVSAISTTPEMIKQNTKIFDHYLAKGDTSFSGHTRTNAQMLLEQLLLDLSAQKKVDHSSFKIPQNLIEQGLVRTHEEQIQLTDNGQYFCQYICAEIVKHNN